MRMFFGLVLAWAVAMPVFAGVELKKGEGRVSVLIDGTRVAVYVYDDPVVRRPYFCEVKTLGGIRVTRPHPPDPAVNKGNADHETMHPGLWLAFGDIDGVDFWRNKGLVRHVRFEGPVVEGPETGSFGVVNRYEKPGGGAVCEEICRYSIYKVKNGYLICLKSSFSSEKEFYFGDQEEMGFGFRLNTPLTVNFGGGGIWNSAGGVNEKGTWGKQAEWCAAGGVTGGRRVGMMVMGAPSNFHPCWFHSRDYGLVVANPFGKKAMTGADDDSVRAARTCLKQPLGFGVFVFDVPEDRQPEYKEAYSFYGSVGDRGSKDQDDKEHAR